MNDLNGVWRYFGSELEDLNNVSVNSFLSMWGGAGALVSTTDELAILVEKLLSTELLEQSTIDEALKSAPDSTSSFSDWVVSYGLGFNLTQYKGNFGYGHGGNGLAKYASFYDRANGITIVFAYNHMADHDNNKRVELSTKLYDMALAEIGK